MNMLISTWALLAAGLVFAFPMIYSRVKNHTELEDETLYVYFMRYSVAHCCLTYLPYRIRMDDTGNLVDADHVTRDRVQGK